MEKETRNVEPRAGAVNETVVLGFGKFSIDGTEIGKTRGGGSFTVEREYRELVQDGAKSKIKGEIMLDRQEPKLVINSLSLFSGVDFAKLFPALTNKSSTTPAGTEIGTGAMSDADYHEVSWSGFDIKGKAVKITIPMAINLENLNWNLVDKDEVVTVLTFTGVADGINKFADFKIVFAS